ncbi:hypothetical protein ACH4U7_50235 [Streptomyces sp. NPDC020845]|uniref:hypothetical protein n=1 Tax=Streptomyces sp. NPDC020845 TaxID=3365096 RepID=UPI0037AEA5F1
MDGFSFTIVDEAHGAAGDLGRPWAAIHDNARIPAHLRLYLTATPRTLASPRPQKVADGQELEIAANADDPDGTYGAWLAELGLSEAILTSARHGDAGSSRVRPVSAMKPSRVPDRH